MARALCEYANLLQASDCLRSYLEGEIRYGRNYVIVCPVQPFTTFALCGHAVFQVSLAHAKLSARNGV